MQNKILALNLQLFGEGTGDAGTGAETIATDAGQQTTSGRNPLANVRYGKQAQESTATEPTQDAAAEKEPEVNVTGSTKEDKKAEFEKLIKGDYKDLFHERVQGIINERFKETHALQEQLNQVRPILDMLSSKYGAKADDPAALRQAIENDDSYYQDEAIQKGLTVEQLKEIKRIERENAELRRAEAERLRAESNAQIQAQWMQESENVKQIYPGFDFASEVQNQDFAKLLGAGIDVKTAYEVVHKDDLIGGAMYKTAQTVKQKLANDIQARGMRPQENGTSGQSAVITKTDVASLSKKDREEIERRVLRGERITF